MCKHDVLLDELRAVFFNPRDVGYLYLEAQFSKQGSRSLREVLRAMSDIRMSTLAIVPESEIRKCLTMPTTSRDQVMVGGQWVQINRGLYKGDVGVVVNHYSDEDSTNGVEVMVVPRLRFSSSSASSFSLKRKRRDPRPSPQLFDPKKCDPKPALVDRSNNQIFIYKSYRFEYGLQLKTYNPRSLSPARELSLHMCGLFIQSKELAGGKFDLFDMWSMPLPSFWRFEPGERVLVQHKEGVGVEKGIISTSSPESVLTRSSSYVVDFGAEREQPVRVTNITKDIILGDFVRVLVGIHAGKTGFVVAKVDALLGICVGQRTNGLVSTWCFFRQYTAYLNLRTFGLM